MEGNVIGAISLMSAPAAKARSLPVITIAPTPSAASKAAAALLSSAISAELSAFRALGRFSVMTPTRPEVEVRMLAYVAAWALKKRRRVVARI